MLEAKDITFSYNNEDSVLKSVNLNLNHGEFIVLTGHTGSGKSTLAKILSGFIPRAIPGNLTGSVSIDGVDISDLSLPEISQKIALVQQDPESQICTLKVSDEIAFGPENYSLDLETIKNRVRTSLESVGCLHLINRSTYALSGGEKQRIAIASMLACSPDFLILDEPTSSLDPRGIKQLVEILVQLRNRGIGILCIEHNIQQILTKADKVLKLDKNGLTQYSSPRTIHYSNLDVTPTQPALDPLIIAKDVSFSYNGTCAIDSVSLDIYPNEIIALMGDNGSGKTTLLRILGGVLASHGGSVHFHSDEMHKLSPRNLAETTGHVFQNPNHQIFERTVWKEQILTLEVLGSLNSDKTSQSKQLLKKSGLSDLETRNPFALSHGQKRRLNITSAVGHNPLLCFFDEPFIGQDQSGRSFATEIIQETAKAGGASIIVTHNPSFASQFCTRIVFLENGKILIDESPQTVLNQLKESIYSEYTELGGNF